MNNSIISRIYYAINIELASPLNISNGQDYLTDSDVMRNGKGELFVPGTSLAGAFRNYLDGNLKNGQDSIFGFSEKQESRMSSIYVSDLYFNEGTAKVSVRDRVQLEDKQVQNKFDMEIIETGAKGTIYVNVVIRKESQQKEYFEKAIGDLLQAIQDGAVRIGKSKNRGMGRLRVLTVAESEYTKDNVDDYIQFKKENRNIPGEMKYDEWHEKYKEKIKSEKRYVKIKIPLEICGGISIRRYSTKPQTANFEHITCQGQPVIPGASWSGAIRSRISDILNELQSSEQANFDTGHIIDTWFGSVDVKGEGAEKKSQQSIIAFNESVIEGAVRLPMTRNKINRFDGSTVNGALYSEIAYVGGKTTLEIMVKKDFERKYEALLGMLDYVIRDLQDGYVAVGGQTAIGRGIFKECGKIEPEDLAKEEYKHNLYSLLCEEG